MFLLFLILSLCGCIHAYRFDMKQGNYLTPENAAEIQPGMSQEEVRYILGTSMVQDIFHYNRWDYIFYEKPGRGKPTEDRLTIYFREGVVERVMRDMHDSMPAAGAA